MSQANHDALPDGPPQPSPYLDPANAPLPADGLLRRHHWLTVLMPFLVYMLVQFMFESRLAPPTDNTKPAEAADADGRGTTEAENAAARELRLEREKKEKHEQEGKIPYAAYPYIYSAKIGLTLLAVLLVIPGYRAFPGRVHLLGVLVGVVGGVLWIGLCKLHLEETVLKPLGLGAILDMGRRPGFNPMEQIADRNWAYVFLAIRFFGLVVIVPIVEEFFLRGFLMRYVMHVDWPLIPFGVTDRLALVCGTAVPMLMHPAELIAAAAWFSLVTWLMLRTRSVWDCIVAHAITNLMIGLWVLWSGDWWLM